MIRMVAVYKRNTKLFRVSTQQSVSIVSSSQPSIFVSCTSNLQLLTIRHLKQGSTMFYSVIRLAVLVVCFARIISGHPDIISFRGNEESGQIGPSMANDQSNEELIARNAEESDQTGPLISQVDERSSEVIARNIEDGKSESESSKTRGNVESGSSESMEQVEPGASEQEDNFPVRSKRSTSTSTSDNVVNDIQFETADITEEFGFLSRTVVLEAFRIRNRTETESPHWVSIGHPRLVKNELGELFQFTPESITTNIGTLDNSHKEALMKRAKLKYPNIAHRIQNTSFIPLPLQQISCSLTFYANGSTHTMQGNVEDFSSSPWRLVFPVVQGNNKREAFLTRIQDEANLDIKCELRAAGKRQQINTLTITADQMQENRVADKVMGPGNEAYVTREQLTGVAQLIRTSMNVEETYEMEDEDFAEEFIQKMMDKTSSDFSHVPIDEWLTKVSNFGAKWDSRDISPNEVKRELSNILKIENHAGEERIVRARSNSSSSSQSRTEGNAFLDFAKNLFTLSFKDDRSSRSGHTYSLDDQLKRFNDESKNHVQWERDGTRIIPKSINVAKVTRGAFNQRFTFNRVKRRISDAKYFRVIVLKTKETDMDNEWQKYTTSTKKSLDELSSDLRSLRNTLSSRGQYLHGVYPECESMNNHDDLTYGWSERKYGLIGLKSISCNKGADWHLYKIDWTKHHSVSRPGFSSTDILHADFMCCRMVYRWKSLI